MSEILSVKNLCKNYPTFTLHHVDIVLEKGKITGFIGRNGAGKSTTMNCILGFVHCEAEEMKYNGMPMHQREQEIKQKIGFVSSGMGYYPGKKLSTITKVTKSFYKEWDEEAYQKYMQEFELDDNKKIKELSTGMKIKYALALALSHQAELLILDEPTSGLDPVSRENLLEILLKLCDLGKTIFFSTHITSDLDKIADRIIYIRKGKIRETSKLKDFVQKYKVITYTRNSLNINQRMIGKRRTKEGWSSLVLAEDVDDLQENMEVLGITIMDADLDSIMIHLESEEDI